MTFTFLNSLSLILSLLHSVYRRDMLTSTSGRSRLSILFYIIFISFSILYSRNVLTTTSGRSVPSLLFYNILAAFSILYYKDILTTTSGKSVFSLVLYIILNAISILQKYVDYCKLEVYNPPPLLYYPCCIHYTIEIS